MLVHLDFFFVWVGGACQALNQVKVCLILLGTHRILQPINIMILAFELYSIGYQHSHSGLSGSRGITGEGLYIRPIHCAAYWLSQIGAGVKLTFHDQFFMVAADTVYL